MAQGAEERIRRVGLQGLPALKVRFAVVSCGQVKAAATEILTVSCLELVSGLQLLIEIDLACIAPISSY